MTAMTSTYETISDFAPAEGLVSAGPAAEAVTSPGPNFSFDVRGRLLLAFAGLMVPAAAALYVYGQISPGV